MAFKLGDLIVDRIQYGVAEDFSGNLLYTLTQLSDASIEITADSTDAVDQTGTLIKRFWRAKTGTFTATNAMINLNILGAKAGQDPVFASEDSQIKMPKIVEVKAGSTLTLSRGYDTEKGDKLAVYAFGTNGSADTSKKYTLGTAASDKEFAVADGVLTPPTDKDEARYLVVYDRQVSEGVAVYNSADKFPRTVHLILKALAVDPCDAGTLRAVYIDIPSFQPSPELTLTLTTDGTLDYNGDLQVDYCSSDKALFTVYWANEDEED